MPILSNAYLGSNKVKRLYIGSNIILNNLKFTMRFDDDSYLKTPSWIDITDFTSGSSGYTVVGGLLKSKVTSNSSSSYLEIPVDVPQGYILKVTIVARASSESGYDLGQAMLNDTKSSTSVTNRFMNISGTTSGTYTKTGTTSDFRFLTLRYYKDSTNSKNDDCFYVEEIKFELISL